MKYISIFLITICIFFNCSAQETPTKFSEEALNDTFITLEGESVSFKSILEKHKGKTVLIDVWASWCKDCVGGLPKVKKLQETYGEINYVFLSLDKDTDKWKNGIEKYQIIGDHYYMQSGWKGPFGTFLNLDWIPRYMVVDPQGQIALYKAVKANDKNIKSALK